MTCSLLAAWANNVQVTGYGNFCIVQVQTDKASSGKILKFWHFIKIISALRQSDAEPAIWHRLYET